MTVKKFDYTKSVQDIFWKIIYPIYAKEFLFGDDYDTFVRTVSQNFTLNDEQWEMIAEHWQQKEEILSIEKL